MQFQLRHLVLWPRNERLAPRILTFDLGRLNVITGASKTGKSAVIPIIDYCLGSERCAVPVTTIRDACSWFGIVVVTREGEKLFARREPGTQQSTGDMFVLEAKTIQIPARIPEKNTSTDAVKRMLDRLAGLSNLGFEPTALPAGFKGRPSFRDLLAFAFQPQNIVANPDVLFFRADTMQHKEKLRTIFPYVLGAVTPDDLARRWEIDEIVRELRRKERELDAQRQASAQWRADLQNWASEARDLGLLDSKQAAPGWLEEDLIASLEDVLAKTSLDAQPSASGLTAGATEAAGLDREEGEVTLQLADVKSRADNMTRLRSSVDEYTGALEKQRERLQLSRWLRDLTKAGAGGCPVCGGTFAEAHSELNSLCDALANTEATARQLGPVPAVFDKELVQVRMDMRVLTDRLKGVRARKRAEEERSARARRERFDQQAVDRFLGRLEQAVMVLRAPLGDPAIAAEVIELKDRLAELRAGSSDAVARQRQATALHRVSGTMARLLPNLDSERPDDRTELNVEDLTIRVTGDSGRPDFLWEIGSGANWLSYHVAAMLGLHELFLSQKGNPVPNFLVFDQPSQVYFPRKLAGHAATGDDPPLADEDVAAVKKVFVALAATAHDKGLQIIVLDHVGTDIWKDAGQVHLVDEWRDGKALIPQQWLVR